ncbi:hypothetical protein ACXR2T_14585 [Leucobacter sp. HY1910]
MKHVAGVLLAGVLAFGGVFAASAISAPLLHGIPAGSSSGQNEPTDEVAMIDELDTAMIGRWKAPLPANQDAFVEFDEHGMWRASDGCNSAEGSWSVEPNGEFDGGDGGAMTQIGCDNVAIPSMVWSATHAAFNDQGQLTLADEQGESMTLERASTDAFTLVGTWTNRGDEVATVEFTPDGNWRGTVGCSEFTGTWMLGVRNVPVLEDNSTEPKPPVLLSGPANLVIGPEADGTVNVCEGGPAKFVLSYDTEYLFHAGADGTFTVEGTEAAPAEPLVFVSR